MKKAVFTCLLAATTSFSSFAYSEDKKDNVDNGKIFSDSSIELTQDKPFFSDNTSIEIKLGGWSHHDSTKLGLMDVPLNEEHKGLGIEYYKEINSRPNHFLGAGFWYMTDSFDSDSYQLSIAYKYRWNVDYLIDSVDFNINAGIVNRTYRTFKYKKTIHHDGSSDLELLGYEDNRDTRAIFAPMITINFLDHMQTDFIYYPEGLVEFGGDYSIFFWRLGVKI